MSADYRDMVDAEHISVYVVENAVRGFVCYWIDGPDVHVEALALAARARRKGAGRMLLDHVDRQGLRAHCRRLIFHSNAQNFENLAYFRGKGLQETDRRIDNGYERIVMERYLR
nr:GNAT family N-acetyltransferase [Oceanibium sediminis]